MELRNVMGLVYKWQEAVDSYILITPIQMSMDIMKYYVKYHRAALFLYLYILVYFLWKMLFHRYGMLFFTPYCARQTCS